MGRQITLIEMISEVEKEQQDDKNKEEDERIL